jgi:hypothetical protein
MDTRKLILMKCSAIRFGNIDIGGKTEFYHRFNSQVSALCRSLPASMQTKAMMFLMEYGRMQVGEPLDFFKYYYAPAWSAIYWLTAAPDVSVVLSEKEMDNALCAQAMAMLLHSFDDHLVDGGIMVSHLTLLIRGQAWRRMNEAVKRFCADLPGGSDIAQGLIDNYYIGITELATPPDLDAYCELFRKQMATWLVMPVLTARKTGGSGEFITDLRRAYESFGIAWRLLDDIQDLEADMADGTRSAVYVCLDDSGHALWDARGQSKGRAALKSSEKICTIIQKAKVLEKIAERIVRELENAAGLADRIELHGLAEEYRVLAGPVVEWK